MISLVGSLLLILIVPAYALVPIEGVLLGEVAESLQIDPLRNVLIEIDTSAKGDDKKLKLFFSAYLAGENLGESCSYLGPVQYATTWEEKQARRSMAATLQYIGLDTTIKAIGAYAKKLNISENNFRQLRDNLITNYCSKNITVFSLKSIRNGLDYYYQKPSEEFVPEISSLAHAPSLLKDLTERPSTRSKELDLVIKNFRAFCSWGGEAEDYRLLLPYLRNPFIMAFVIKNMSGIKDVVDEKQIRVVSTKSEDTVQVACTDLFCRSESPRDFQKKFPLSRGSTGIHTDLPKIYCHHFRFQNSVTSKAPQVNNWLKAMELEDPIFETSQFIALLNRVPDFMNGVQNYRDISLIIKSSVDERWNTWAKQVLNSFSRDLFYEESLAVRSIPIRDPIVLQTTGFQLNLSVTLGELDRLLRNNDKQQLRFDLKLSKNYLRQILVKWKLLESEVDVEGKKDFRDEVARYLNLQLREKQKLFMQKMWTEDFGRILADELIQQAIHYRGDLFDSYKDEMITIPVNFSYGLFALHYLSYRANLNADRLKLKI